MNKVFKVIWNEARNAYVVVSEIAKNHGSKSCSTKKLLTMLIATGVMTCASMAPAMADNPAPDDLNVTIGNKANVSVWNSVTGKNISGDIAVGPNAHAWNGEYSYGSEGRIGSKEYYLDFGQGGVVGAEWLPFVGYYKYKVADGSKIAGSIAIGKNTVARTGSVMVGDHSYTGKLGDIEIKLADAMTNNNGIYSTTLGAGAYNSGSLAAVTGALSIASGSDTKNTGATIYGSMNSIESATSSSDYSGVASSVLGFANRTQNANAALIWGTGNEVTNSIEKVGIDTNWNNVSVAEAQKKAIEAMQSSDYAGGSVMAIGGGNKADYAKYSQLTGVKNKVTGTEAKAAKYDFVNGYQNTVTNASDVTVIGIKNEVTADGNKVIGDNHKVSGKDNVIFGSADKVTETTVNNAVVLGHNAKVTGEGGVALGAGSVADRANAVSVGSTGANRQIINVAAGEADTDAVNVSQLKKATANANKGWKLSTEGGAANQVASEATVDFSGKKDAGDHQNITVSNDGNNVKIDLASELHNVTGVVNGDSRVTLAPSIAGITNGQASVVMLNGSTTINGVVGIDNTGKISGVANGEADKDAVNYGQLKDVKAEALKHSTVTNSDNITVTEGLNKDGGKEYKVALDKDITLAGDTGDFVSISGSKGTIWATGSVTAGSVVAGDVVMDSTTATVSGLNNKTIAYEGFATTGKAATEEQLKEVATEAGKHTTLSDGKNTTVTSTVKDGQTDYKVNVAGDLTDITSVANGSAKLALNGEAGYAGIVNGQGASVFMQGSTTVINQNVSIDKDGKISGVAAGTADKDAVNYGQLKNISAAATAAKTEIKGGTNIANVDQTTADDGHMVYTVNANGTTVSGDSNVAVNAETKDNNVTNYAVKLNKDLQGIESISNNTSKLVLREGWAGMQNGVGASVFMVGGLTTINGKVTVDEQGKISGVAAGVADTDAVNVGQLKDVKAEAGKHTTLSNGKNTTVEAAVKDGQTDYKVNVAGDLTDISSVANGNAKLALDGAAGTAGIVNGQGASVFMQGSTTVINQNVSIDKDGKISGVAAGTADKDAVNYGQLKNISAAATAAKTEIKGGTNIANVDQTTADDGHMVYTVNANGTTVSGDSNVAVTAETKDNNVTNYAVKLKKDLKGIESVSNGSASLTLSSHPVFGATAKLTNGKASVELRDSTTIINGQVQVRQDGTIGGVTDGRSDKDAVNVSQLQKAAAASAATVTDGVNTTVTTTTAEDGHVDYKVNLNKNLTGVESISNGGASLTMNGFATELANGQGASVKLFGDTTTINGKVNVYKDGRIAGVADGVNANDAVNVSQLQKAAAASATTVSDGVNTTVTATKAEDGHTDYKVNLNKDLVGIESISNGDAKLTLGGFATELANGQGASVKLFGDTTTINNAVTVYKDGRIAGVANGINDNDAVNVGQLNKVSEIANKGWNLATNGVATEATNVKPGDYVDFSGDKNISVSHDGTKVKVELNKDLDVNSVQTNALNSKYNLSVGTMAENGIMPFFVNSTGAFYAASNKFSVDKDGNVNANSVQTNALNSKYNLSVGTANENGTVPFFVNSNGAFYAANGKLVVDKDGKVTATAGEIGNVVLNNGVYTGHSALRDGELFVGDASGNYSQITTKGAKLGKVTIAEDGKISGVAAGEVSSTSTDAINGSQLHQTNENVAALDKRVTQNEADIAANKANIAQNAADIAANKANIAQNKADIAQNKADIAQNKADIAQNKTDIKNLDNRVTNVEELAKKHTTVTAGDNITVTEDTNKDGGKEYKVALDKDIKLDSVTTGQTVMNNDGLKVGKDVSVTATAVTAGKTSISDEGVKVGDKTYISDKGLNANGQQITNVADGKENGDAVNYGQLKGVENQVISNSNRINQLGSRVNKVGAGAAALAALHPMDFDPDDKLTFSAGYGNYGGENAAAIGAYYRPDEKVMFSVGGTVGNGENMVNAGVSFSLDRTNHVSNSRTAMAREILDLRAEVTELKAMVAKGGLGSIAEDKMKIFPDVAENHWAYEYVGKLAAAGIIEGYPDGNFSGDRMMSRYEFAAMLYRAMQKGAQLDSKIINEFAPEMGRIRVDRISGEDGDRDKIERVRVNAVKGERDHYGNKIAKAEAKAK